MGRPSEFTQEIAAQICEQLADGKSLRSICRSDEMPALSTVFRWLRLEKGFSDQYARAKDDSADAMADDILEIADDKSEDAQSRRVRIDARKWIASKLKPKKYGEKVEQTVQGPDGGPVQGFIKLVGLESDKGDGK